MTPPTERPGAEFRDPDLQARFDDDGYVVVPFLDAAGVASLRAVWAELAPPPGFGSHYTSASTDLPYRAAVFEAIAATFSAPIDRILQGLRPVVANFFAKEPALGTSLVIHQDWTFVDERTDRSLNIWCPLEDATEQNGTLSVLPGSHRRLHNLRGTAAGVGGLPSPFAGREEELTRSLLVPVPVTAGHAIINDHRLVHASGDNRSDALRLAASLTLVPADRAVRHAFGREDGRVDLVEMDDAAVRRHAIGTRPEGRLIATIDLPPSGFDPLDYESAAPTEPSAPSPPSGAPGGGAPAATTARPSGERTERGMAAQARRIVRRVRSGNRNQMPH